MAAGPIEGEKMQFRTQMINGKAQILFDALEEPSVKPQPKRNTRSTTNPTAMRPQAAVKSKASSQKPLHSSLSKKSAPKANRVTFSDSQSPAGVFMTMEEISELVKTVKESATAQNNPTITKMTTIQTEEPRQQFYAVPSTIATATMDIPLQALAPISPRQEALGLMADKKRYKWLREKAEMDRMKLEVEYDQLKHQLSPHHQKTERAAIPSDYSSLAKPPLPPTVKPYDHSQDSQANDLAKTRLMEKKQHQWKLENAEKAPVWNPFGRPGAGAPNANEMPPRATQPATSNVVMPYRPADVASEPMNITLNDQTRVPAAMRTNLLFGDVRFDDDVRTAKEIERRQWLEDLRKQIDENKRQKVTQLETERRQDFLQENLQPLMQEATNRHPPPQPAPPSPENTLPTNNTVPETTKSRQRDSIVQQTYNKILEATELAKYEKKAQLIEKLKRNGHNTDLLANTKPGKQSSAPSSTTEKNYDYSPKKIPVTVTTKVEPLHLNVGNDTMQSYRTTETKRDEAVNTINSTFRSDNSVQTDFPMPPARQMFSYTREESDLPPQVPHHLLRSSKTGQNKKNVRIRSLEDNTRQRRSSVTTTSHSNNTISKDDGATSQLGTNRSHHGPIDIVHRPLWNYHNPEHREYVSNSRRDPHYDKRQRQIDDGRKKTPYNRWNSDSELQPQQRPKEKAPTSIERPRPVISKAHNSNDDTVMNSRQRPTKHDAFLITKTDDRSRFMNLSSLDKYEHYIPYTRTDEILDPARAYSPIPQSREPSAQQPRTDMTMNETHRQRQNANVQPPPYHVPPSRQDHILQQLSAIKENLVRRQQELTSSMNAIPV